MSWTRVVKFAVADTDGEVVLVHVTAKSAGSLDLDLLATDGDSAFKAKVRDRSLGKLRAKNYSGSDNEWKDILKHIFISKQADAALHTIEASCSKSGQDPHITLTIAIRRRVENITQRLGVVELPQTDDIDAVDLFGWSSQLIDERDNLAASLQKEKGLSTSTHDTIASLQAQLADLVEAKKSHERELLAKFAALLNEKKKELRKRTRQLGAVQVNSDQLKQLEDDLGPASREKISRGRKRPAEQDPSDSESDAFERPANADESKGVSDDEEMASDHPPSTAHSSSTDTAEDDLDQPTHSQNHPQPASPLPPRQTEGLETMPPRRELPFPQKTKEHVQLPAPVSTGDDEDTASEDDEL